MPTAWLNPDDPFPPVDQWDADGLVAVGGGMGTDRLLEAYSRGIFPWDFYRGHPMWFCPEDRIIFDPKTWRPHRRLARTIRSAGFHFTVDKAFSEVVRQCGTVPRPGQQGTWIKPIYIRAILKMHELGFAHSVECWQGDILAGGLYGVALGAVFCGESMFHRTPDASKAAFAALAAACRILGITLIDGQVPNRHLIHLGGVIISREDFLERLQNCLPPLPYLGNRWEITETQIAAELRANTE